MLIDLQIKLTEKRWAATEICQLHSHWKELPVTSLASPSFSLKFPKVWTLSRSEKRNKHRGFLEWHDSMTESKYQHYANNHTGYNTQCPKPLLCYQAWMLRVWWHGHSHLTILGPNPDEYCEAGCPFSPSHASWVLISRVETCEKWHSSFVENDPWSFHPGEWPWQENWRD